MIAQPRRPASTETLMVWVLHRFAEVFSHHAILKGGMSLRLHDCPRFTNDLDFVFAPFASKNEIKDAIQNTLEEIEDADIQFSAHSTMLRAQIRLDDALIQVEIAVAKEIKSEAMSSDALARAAGVPPRLVRVVAPEVAMAHELAAWNERRLLRDLYDLYFYWARLRVTPDLTTLSDRLANMRSRLPKLNKRKQMSLAELAAEFSRAIELVDQAAIDRELSPLLDSTLRLGLARSMLAALRGLHEHLVETD